MNSLASRYIRRAAAVTHAALLPGEYRLLRRAEEGEWRAARPCAQSGQGALPIGRFLGVPRGATAAAARRERRTWTASKTEQTRSLRPIRRKRGRKHLHLCAKHRRGVRARLGTTFCSSGISSMISAETGTKSYSRFTYRFYFVVADNKLTTRMNDIRWSKSRGASPTKLWVHEKR